MKKYLIILSLGLVAHAQAQYSQVYENANGFLVGRNAQYRVGFNGATPTVQRKGVAQGALATVPATGTLTVAGTPVALTKATGVLTLPVNPTAADTLVLGSVTYHFVVALSGTITNQVVIGHTTAATLANLAGAINATANISQQNGITYYLTAGTANAAASAVSGSATLTATALTGGTAGNSIATTETFTSGSNVWAASTLLGGLAGATVTTGTDVYTFSTYLASANPNLVLVNGTSGTATNLAAIINGVSTSVSAAPSAGVVTLSALLSGTAGNAIALATSGTAVSLSGSFCSGGTQFADGNATANLVNELRAAMVQKGLIKGAN